VSRPNEHVAARTHLRRAATASLSVVAVVVALAAARPAAAGAPSAGAAVTAAASRIVALSGATWSARFAPDGRLVHAEGSGVPWLPGRGNALAAFAPPDVLAYLEERARAFLAENGALFQLGDLVLRRDDARSGPLGASGTLWLLAFDVLLGDLPVQDARLRFVVSHGNLVAVASDVPGLAPEATAAARAAAGVSHGRAATGFVRPSRLVLPDGRRIAAPRWRAGKLKIRWAGAAWEEVWEGIVTDGPDGEPFQLVVSATSGAVLRFTPLRVPGQAVGGVLLRAQNEPQTMVPLANLDVSDGATDGVTDAAGRHGLGGPVAAHLSGPYVRVSDGCGATEIDDPAGALLDFGATTSADCVSPVPGAPGDTTAARTASYHLNRLRDLYKAYDPVTPWLDTAVDVNTNYPFECANYYDANLDAIVLNWQGGSSVCANAGHNPALLYHEWGHAYQWNQKGFFADGGTREGYADVTGFLQLPSSCPFAGFFLHESGTSGCAGGRSLDYTLLSPPLPARPDTIASPPYTCPTTPPGGGGVANFQSHCEAAIPTQAVYDLALALQAKYGVATGMRRLLEMWIVAGPLQVSAWQIVDPGPPLVGDGCHAGSWYRTLRVANDDDGDLLNGVPDEAALFDAFERHGIACGTRDALPPDSTTCPPVAAPVASLAYDAAEDGVRLTWLPVDAATGYRVSRSELGPDGPFTPIATLGAEQLEHLDRDGTARVLHWYVVDALAAGGCSSAIESVLPSSTCATAATLAAPLADGVVTSEPVTLAWTLVPNAATHAVSLGLAGDLRLAGTTSESSLELAAGALEPGIAYHWRVDTAPVDEACPLAQSATRAFRVAGTAASPALTAVTPAVGSSAGGTEVRIEGTNLYLGAQVFFGSTAATVLSYASPTEIVVRAPATTPGPAVLRVVNPGGGEASWPTFAYLPGEAGLPLLQNGAVEKLDGNGVRPPGWARAGSVRPPLSCKAPRYVHEGECSVRFRGETLPNGRRAIGSLTQTIDVATPRPPRLRVRFFVRTKNVPANARARVSVDLLAAGALAERFTVKLDAGSYAFREYDVTFDPTVSYDALSVQIFYKASSGRMWIDDVRLEYVE